MSRSRIPTRGIRRWHRQVTRVLGVMGLGVAAAIASATTSGAAPEKAPKLDAPKDKAASAPLRGETIDYPYDGGGKSRLSWTGRAFVHERALERAKKGEALPLVVFLHGLNKALIPHRWMGGGNEGDVRRITSALIEAGTLPPLVVAGPGSISREAVGGAASFAEIDTDEFLARTDSALAGKVRIDPSRVVVVGHSGAGCSAKGGIVAALRGKRPILGVASIDTCMGGDLAKELAKAPPRTHVVVTWQDASWSKRPFELFAATFKKEAAAHPAAKDALRELDHLPALPKAHDATVAQTFEKWLSKMLTPPPP